VFETVRVQVRTGGTWTDVSGAAMVPANYSAASAASFDSLVITFPPVTGDGLRIIGSPRGGQWVGCAELDVYGTPAVAAVPMRAVHGCVSPMVKATRAFDVNGRLVRSTMGGVTMRVRVVKQGDARTRLICR
jgi:hypothetical protein